MIWRILRTFAKDTDKERQASAKNKRSGDHQSSLLFILLSHLGEIVFLGEPQVAELVLDDKLGNGIHHFLHDYSRV